ncbi:Zinc finger BED domain containing protein 1 [Dissostichus eleginoides]|uniref:Zinc finger BED domain containing protein 1 n=1 Tax=Dissostichus eleginoides TaxID=100907 RepID=A0AAD9C6X0_DISEL|nr:Zinc finger BED domain containing protein 1 [Dissostichus eleginoides]
MLNHLKLKHKTLSLEPESERQEHPLITSFTSARRHCDPARRERITALITRMITKDMLPLSFVEGEGFRELMNFVEPEYRVPTRKTIVSRVEQKYEEGVKKLKMDISQSEKVAITTDSWTTLTTESYTTITCHYITDGWEMKSAVLQTRSSDERHTAQNIAAQLQAAAEEWGLTDKITACVHDNASNMVLANRTIADWESVPCYAHTLQLAVNDRFKVGSVHRVVAACGRLVSHFHHSTVAPAGLKKKQDTHNLPKHKLIQYSRTRWNSICDMFERLPEQRWALSAALSDRTITKLNDARTLELTDQNCRL